VHGVQSTPNTFDLSKIRTKSLKMREKSLKKQEKSLKIFGQNLWRSGKNGVQRCLTARNGANVCRKINEDLFLWKSHQKHLHDLCGRKFVTKSRTTTFWTSLEKFGQKYIAPQNICFFLHLCFQLLSETVPHLEINWRNTTNVAVKINTWKIGERPRFVFRQNLGVTPIHITNLAYLSVRNGVGNQTLLQNHQSETQW